jgi:DNA-binding transcriptional LysR family regulator
MNAYFEYYKIFYYAALTRSLTAAAERLSLTQPSVTRAVKNLETHLGVTLFTRSRHGVALTPDGEILYRRVAPACRLLFSAEQELARRKGDQTGLVRLAVDGAVARSGFFTAALRTFRTEFPAVQLSIEDVGTDAPQKLMNGLLDLCFFSGTAEILLPPELHRATLCTLHHTVVVGRDFAYLAGRELRPEELADCPRLLPGQDNPLPDSRPETPPGDAAEPSAAPILAESIDTRIQLAKAGFGYALVPRICVLGDLRAGTLVELSVQGLPRQSSVELLTPGNRTLSHPAQYFADLLRDRTAMESL